jgi:hypothetical protein
MPKARKPIAEKAQALLDAHVRFIIEQLDEKALKARVESEIDATFADIAKMRLDEFVSPAQIKAVARRYAVELELAGGIPELVGDIARLVHAHPSNAQTRLRDLMSDRQLGEFLDKGLELETVRLRIIDAVLETPVFSELASDLIYRGIKGYLAQNQITRNVPGARTVMKLGRSVMSAAGPALERSIEDTLKKYVHASLKSTLRETGQSLKRDLDRKRLREIALDLWDEVRDRPVSEFIGLIESRDLEDFFVIGFEYWRELRKNPHYSALIDAGIDGFFERYGKVSVPALLEDIGIRREMLVAEAMRFAPPVIATLKRKKRLEPIVRRQLEDFYRSPEATRILG